MAAARVGRKPSGPRIVERLEGSPLAKERLLVILQTIAKELTIDEACEKLGIGETRFHELRTAALQDTLTFLEPRQPGRPPQDAPSEEVQSLVEENTDLREALHRRTIELELAHIGKSESSEDLKKRRRNERRAKGLRRRQRRKKPR